MYDSSDTGWGYTHCGCWQLKWRRAPGQHVVLFGFRIFSGDLRSIFITIENLRCDPLSIQFKPGTTEGYITDVNIVENGLLKVWGTMVPQLLYIHIWTAETFPYKDFAVESDVRANTNNVATGSGRGYAAGGFSRGNAAEPDTAARTMSPTACGIAADWNAQDNESAGSERRALFWSVKMHHLFKENKDRKADIRVMIAFLRNRLDSTGTSVMEQLEYPIRQGNNWFSFAFKPYTASVDTELRDAGWLRAWHGCKIESLYSILYHGQLFESADPSRGERTKGGKAGVYLHKDGTGAKADNYTRFVPLCSEDGMFFAAKWEVRVNRKHRVKLKSKDQWAQKEGGNSIRLVALWVCVRTFSQMVPGDGVSRGWEPEKEANPHTIR